jgi:uncharacterized phage protein gp47/JayE
MPWSTPTLKDVRALVRDHIRGSLPGADATIPNSVLRVMSDSQGALCHLTLQYVDWLALQLIPDTAEHEWLDRHGDIWLVNSDGTTGRKGPALASGTVEFTATQDGIVIPISTRLTDGATNYETLETIITSASAGVGCSVRAIDPGTAGNLDPGTALAPLLAGVTGIAGITVVTMTGGTEEETDDQLRFRVLQRIQQPPMGGALHDYVRWALAVPGVTRAWCAPLEMGIGTVTVRFLMDDLRADDDGWPTSTDVEAVTAYIDTVRPVAVKDFFVVAPIKQRIDFYIDALVPDAQTTRTQIEASIREMLFLQASPGQNIYAAWKSYAIMNAAGVESFRLTNNDDDVMGSPGHMAVLGDIIYG